MMGNRSSFCFLTAVFLPKFLPCHYTVTMNDKITVQNVNVPDRTTRVNAEKYGAMKIAFLHILPPSPPGLTQKEIQEGVIAHLPESLFPGGKTASWWAKTVQLDLEAKGVVNREQTKPLRWYKNE